MHPFLTPRTPFIWQLRTRSLDLGPRTLLLGILNVTPDSFSDGGHFFTPAGAIEHGLRLLDEGADILDIGGESTRPNATPIPAEEELSRILAVIYAIRKARPDAILSIDTYHASTAEAAINAGAEIVNDVSGLLWDPAMASTVARLRPGLILMHTRGRPHEWATQPPLPPLAVLPTVLTGLRDSLLTARKAGLPAANIILDPGFGFGKRGDENFILHALLPQLHQFGLPLLTGTSRKRFLNKPNQVSNIAASTASNVASILAGAHLLRIHEIPPALEAARIADQILAAAARTAEAQRAPIDHTHTTTVQ